LLLTPNLLGGLLPPNLLWSLLPPDLLWCRLLVDAFLFPGLSGRHSIFLLPEYLLRLRLRPLLLPSAITAVAAATVTTATMLFLSRRSAMRISASFSLALS